MTDRTNRLALAAAEALTDWAEDGLPEEDLPPIPDDLLRLASPDAIRAIRARKEQP